MSRAPWRLTVRRGPLVERSRHATLDDALAAAASGLEDAGRLPGHRALVRDIGAGERVAVRAEVRGPGGRRGGVDVRGDGSGVAYTGRIVKRPVEPQAGEAPLDALRRSMKEGEVSGRLR